MRYLKSQDLIDYLSKSGMRVFGVGDAAKLMNKKTGYVSLILSKNRKIMRIEKGKYYVQGTSPYEIASRIVYPCYISLLAGLQYYNLISQNVIRYSVITTKRHRNIRFKNGEIDFVRISRKAFFGYTSDNNVYIAKLEKLFIDCLYFNTPFSQIEESFRLALEDNTLDIPMLKKYAIKMGRSSLINKLGFLLESNAIECEDLLPHIYKAKYVEVRRKTKGKSKKWRVLYDR